MLVLRVARHRPRVANLAPRFKGFRAAAFPDANPLIPTVTSLLNPGDLTAFEIRGDTQRMDISAIGPKVSDLLC